MGPRLHVGRRAVALATAVSFALTPAAPLEAAPAQAPAASPAVGPPAPKPPAPKPAPAASPAPSTAAAAAPANPPDLGWPRAYATPSGGKIIVYQPQIATWEGQKQMTAFAAVSYEAKGATKPALGSIKLEA